MGEILTIRNTSEQLLLILLQTFDTTRVTQSLREQDTNGMMTEEKLFRRLWVLFETSLKSVLQNIRAGQYAQRGAVCRGLQFSKISLHWLMLNQKLLGLGQLTMAGDLPELR